MNPYLKSVVFIALLLPLCLISSIAYADHVCGDTNGDGGLNVSDAVYLINYVFVQGSPPPDPNCCGVPCGEIVTDYDGNFYRTILIGDKCWMMDNLRVTHYRNGDPIPNVAAINDWDALNTGAYCNYLNNSSYAEIYGRIYNFYAVIDSRNIAPEGWHVATDDDWQALADYLGGDAVAGGKIKMAGTMIWQSPNTDATNQSGFTAMPGGYRDQWGNDHDMASIARFWTSTSNGGYGWYRKLAYDNAQLERDWLYGRYGLSVRCVKDE